MNPEQQRKYEELLQRAMQRNPNLISPEQAQVIEAAMGRMQQVGGGEFNAAVIQTSDGALDPQSGWPQPGSPPADPYTERQLEFAKDDLRRWLAQYEPYRGKGQFAALEALFEMARRVTG